MKVFTIISLFGLSVTVVHSQDMLTTRAGATYPVKVLEINDSAVCFKMYANQDGPTYRIGRRNVTSIQYANGTSEQFAIEDPKDPEPVVINGFNTAPTSTASALTYSSSVTFDFPSPPQPAPPPPQKITAGDVIGAIFFTGLFAMKVAASVNTPRYAAHHTHGRCVTR